MTLERAAAYIDSGSRPQSEAGLGLRMWAAFVNDNGAGLPTFSSWETTNQNPAYYLSLLQSGRRVLPTFFYSPSLTEATWNANAGRTSGAQALAEYCNAHRLPICLRMDNLEGAFYTDAQYQKNYDDSPFVQPADFSGVGVYRQDCSYDASNGGQVATPVTDGWAAGDFVVIKTSIGADGVWGSTNGLAVNFGSRVIAKVADADPTDGADWYAVRRVIGSYSTDAMWTAAAGAYFQDTFFARLVAEIPNPPLVILATNNEPTLETFQANNPSAGYWRDHRMDAAFPGLQKTFLPNPPGRTEGFMIYRKAFLSKYQALLAGLHAGLPGGWSAAKVIAYNSTGGQGAAGLRARSGSPDALAYDLTGTAPYDSVSAQGTEYGIDWAKHDGGLAEFYIGKETGGATGESRLESRVMKRQAMARLVNDYTRPKVSGWFQGAIHYAAAGEIRNMLPAGLGYVTPERTAGTFRFSAFLLGSQFQMMFEGNGTPLTEQKITPELAAEYGVPIFTHADHSLAAIDGLEEFWGTALREAMAWPLALAAKPTADPWEFEDEGPLAAAGSLYLLPHTGWNIETAAGTDSPAVCLCRRNGSGRGAIFAWSALNGPESVTVTTPDGSLPVTATVRGDVFYY